jgi:hypothetical protein
MHAQPTVRFSVIGINHAHIYSQVNLLTRAGAQFVSSIAPGRAGWGVPKAIRERRWREAPKKSLTILPST